MGLGFCSLTILIPLFFVKKGPSSETAIQNKLLHEPFLYLTQFYYEGQCNPSLLRLIRVDPPAAVVGEKDDDGVPVLVCLLQRPNHLAHRRLQLLQPGFRIRIDLMRIRIRIRIQHFFLLRIRIQGLMT